MKRVIIIFFISIFLMPGILRSQEGYVRAKISEESLDNLVPFILYTKILNFGKYFGIPFKGVDEISISVNTLDINLVDHPTENIRILMDLTGRLNFKILSMSFEVTLAINDLMVYGRVEQQSIQGGFKLVFVPIRHDGFSPTTGTIFDIFIPDVEAGYLPSMNEISLNAYTDIFPESIVKLFTSNIPALQVTDNDIILSYEVNEYYLANNDISSSKNYSSSLIHAGPDYRILNTGNVVFTSARDIRLLPGFEAHANSEFRTVIDPDAYAFDEKTLKTGKKSLSESIVVLDTLEEKEESKIPAAEIPDKYDLAQNFPNPFNPSTNIKFDLPEQAFVKLVIYDNLGREVVRLVDGQLNAGYHQYYFNGEKLSSGIYFYKLIAGNFTSVKKMTLVK